MHTVPLLTNPEESIACAHLTQHGVQTCLDLVETSTLFPSQTSRATHHRRRPTGNLAAGADKENEKTAVVC